MNKFFLFAGIGAAIVVVALWQISRYGAKQYQAGYNTARLEYQASGNEKQTDILNAPKASRDDQVFINDIRKGNW